MQITNKNADRNEFHPLEYDQAEYVGTLRTQSHANADLVDTLTDRIRSDAIDADGCEGERQKREDVQSEESHALRRGDAGNDLVHRPDIENRLVLIDGPDGVLYGGKDGRKRKGSAHDQAHGLIGTLEGGEIDGGAGALVEACVEDRAHDADDFAEAGWSRRLGRAFRGDSGRGKN